MFDPWFEQSQFDCCLARNIHQSRSIIVAPATETAKQLFYHPALLVSLDTHTLAALWILLNLLLEPRLNRLQNLLISLAADEADGDTLGSEASRTTDTMEVGVGSLSE